MDANGKSIELSICRASDAMFRFVFTERDGSLMHAPAALNVTGSRHTHESEWKKKAFDSAVHQHMIILCQSSPSDSIILGKGIAGAEYKWKCCLLLPWGHQQGQSIILLSFQLENNATELLALSPFLLSRGNDSYSLSGWLTIHWWSHWPSKHQ